MRFFRRHLILVGIVTLLLLSARAWAAIDPIPLRSKTVAFMPKEFYVAKVTDERSERKALALLVQLSGDGMQTKTTPVALKGGDFVALKDFILRTMPRNESYRPVTVAIRKAQLRETASATSLVKGKMDIELAFYLETEGAPIHLITYAGAIKYSRSVSSHAVVEAAISESVTGALKFFNSWIDREVRHNIKLARDLKFHFEDYQATDGDTLYYSVNRPLIWDDFRDIPRNDVYAAEVFAGFGFDERTTVKDGILHVTLVSKVFLPKSASWVRAGYKHDHVLNHEQRHFDIAKIIAERFKRKVLSATLTLSNYEGFLGPEYLEALREMNKLQTQYDTETGHGRILTVQDDWNRKIDNELRSFGIVRPQDGG